VEFITTLDLAKDLRPILCKANNKKSLDREQKITISLIERREKRNQVGIEKLLVNYYLLLLNAFFWPEKNFCTLSVSLDLILERYHFSLNTSKQMLLA
jgi:hypothetical protein